MAYLFRSGLCYCYCSRSSSYKIGFIFWNIQRIKLTVIFLGPRTVIDSSYPAVVAWIVREYVKFKWTFPGDRWFESRLRMHDGNVLNKKERSCSCFSGCVVPTTCEKEQRSWCITCKQAGACNLSKKKPSPRFYCYPSVLKNWRFGFGLLMMAEFFFPFFFLRGSRFR